MSPSDHGERLAKLLNEAPTLRIWLEEMRGFARDGQGRRIVLGLTAAETIEFIALDLLYQAERDALNTSDIQHRYTALREKHDEARVRDACENLDFAAKNERHN